MKFPNEMMSFKVSRIQPRNHVARDMLDRNGPYRERVVHPKKTMQNRKPKNAREYFGEE
jgi:hypothetical protein